MEASRNRSAQDALEALALFAFLFGFWLVLSNRYEWPALLMGVASAALVTAATHERLLRAGRVEREIGRALRKVSPLRLARYGLWLLRAVVRANFEVAWVVIQPQLPVAPRLFRFRVGFEGRVPAVVLAHSITLTPGTVTIDLEDGRYLVHALIPSSADELVSGRMQGGVAAAFGERAEAAPAVEWIDSVHAPALRGGERAR